MKYLRLRADDPSWYLSLGGELRERVELTSNPDFGLGGRRDGYLLQRITLEADLHLGQRVRIYVEGISGLMWDEDSPRRPSRTIPPTCNLPSSMSFRCSPRSKSSPCVSVALA
ncbi:MAG: alginate export family protein [Chthoniobacter sp.]